MDSPSNWQCCAHELKLVEPVAGIESPYSRDFKKFFRHRPSPEGQQRPTLPSMTEFGSDKTGRQPSEGYQVVPASSTEPFIGTERAKENGISDRGTKGTFGCHLCNLRRTRPQDWDDLVSGMEEDLFVQEHEADPRVVPSSAFAVQNALSQEFSALLHAERARSVRSIG